MGKKGISIEHNWSVFRFSATCFAAAAWLSVIVITWAAPTHEEEKKLPIIALVGSVASVGYASFMLMKHVPWSITLTLIILGFLFSLVIAFPMAGIFSVPLPLLMYTQSITVAHLFEYLFVCGYHPNLLEWDSFLIN